MFGMAETAGSTVPDYFAVGRPDAHVVRMRETPPRILSVSTSYSWLLQPRLAVMTSVP
jgi:hypothetical protein